MKLNVSLKLLIELLLPEYIVFILIFFIIVFFFIFLNKSSDSNKNPFSLRFSILTADTLYFLNPQTIQKDLIVIFIQDYMKVLQN